MALLCAAQFVVVLDATIVAVALPAIGSDLGADLAGLQWTVNGYTLTLASFILLGGSLGDEYGRRRIFVLGIVWFALASVLCGMAQSIEMLILGRVLKDNALKADPIHPNARGYKVIAERVAATLKQAGAI